MHINKERREDIIFNEELEDYFMTYLLIRIYLLILIEIINYQILTHFLVLFILYHKLIIRLAFIYRLRFTHIY